MKKIFLVFFILISGKIFSQESCAKKIIVPVLSETAKKDLEQKLTIAESDYKKDSTSADAIIWYGRRTAYTGTYLRAIEIFSNGIALHPLDARMYRHRAHRYITIRCFDKAIADLEKATSLILGKNDVIEPDGMPNEKNIPTSTLHTNIWYHLGLTYFIRGEYKKADKAYKRCLEASTNDDMYVATANWAYLTLLKLGKDKKASRLISSIPKNPDLIENFDYWKLINGLYRDRPIEKDIDTYSATITKGSASLGTATISFGIGFYCLTQGYTGKAKEFFEKAIATGSWSSFGFIAAERELHELKRIRRTQL